MSGDLVPTAGVEPMRDEIVQPVQGPQVERLNYGVSCKNLDFGVLNARNQLIKTAVNPLLDLIMAKVKEDRALRGGAKLKQRFVVNIVVTAERDLDTVQ